MEKDFEKELKDDIKINLDNIHGDLITHSEKYLKWGRRWVKAKRMLSKAKNEEKLIIAERRKSVRAENATSKITVSEIDDLAISHPDYQKAVSELINAQEEFDLYDLIINTFEHRRSMLTMIFEMNERGFKETIPDFIEENSLNLPKIEESERVQRLRKRYENK